MDSMSWLGTSGLFMDQMAVGKRMFENIVDGKINNIFKKQRK